MYLQLAVSWGERRVQLAGETHDTAHTPCNMTDSGASFARVFCFEMGKAASRLLRRKRKLNTDAPIQEDAVATGLPGPKPTATAIERPTKRTQSSKTTWNAGLKPALRPCEEWLAYHAGGCPGLLTRCLVPGDFPWTRESCHSPQMILWSW
jgi:hypothetical protein